jgi:hypothetical protein
MDGCQHIGCMGCRVPEDIQWFGTIFVAMSLLHILGTALWFLFSRQKELWRERLE